MQAALYMGPATGTPGGTASKLLLLPMVALLHFFYFHHNSRGSPPVARPRAGSLRCHQLLRALPSLQHCDEHLRTRVVCRHLQQR